MQSDSDCSSIRFSNRNWEACFYCAACCFVWRYCGNVALNAVQMRGKLGKPGDSRTGDLDKRPDLSFSPVVRKWINSSTGGLSGQEGLR